MNQFIRNMLYTSLMAFALLMLAPAQPVVAGGNHLSADQKAALKSQRITARVQKAEARAGRERSSLVNVNTAVVVQGSQVNDFNNNSHGDNTGGGNSDGDNSGGGNSGGGNSGGGNSGGGQ